MQTVALTLDAVFKETIGHNQLQLQHYEKLYKLPRLQYIQHTCSQTLSYIQKKNGFVIVVLYTTDGKVFATYDGATWGLPGASIKNQEDLHDTIQRIVKRIDNNLDIRDVHPMSFIDNTFCHKNNAHTLQGIIFTARISNPSILENYQHGGLFTLHEDFIEGVQKYGNRDILTYFNNNIIPRITQIKTEDNQDEEIEINEKMKYRYLIHRKRGKPILKLLGINKNHVIKKRITKQCEDAKNIIDVSCGDDDIINNLGNKKESLIVANDISWSQVQLLKANKSNILCTNHNASDLPFKDKIFDVALCKNTLHHMPHRSHLLGLLLSMKRIAKKIIIVEIENPNHTGGFSRILHKHRYRGFLKDAGGAYFGSDQFTSIIDYVFGGSHLIEQGVFNTRQGRYFWATIEIK